MSVRELAVRAGVTPKTLIDLEYGRRRANLATMRSLCGALGVPPQQIAEFAAALAEHQRLPAPSPPAARKIPTTPPPA